MYLLLPSSSVDLGTGAALKVTLRGEDSQVLSACGSSLGAELLHSAPGTIRRAERKELSKKAASHLEGHRVGNNQEDPQGQPSFVSPVTP